MNKVRRKKISLVILVILAIIVLVTGIFVGLIGYKLNHLITPEIQQEVMSIYRTYSLGPQTLDSVYDLAAITSISCTIKGLGPITVTPAKLNGEEITLVTLGGTQIKEGQATSMKESKLASEGNTNDYLKAVVKLFDNDTVPKDKPVLISGLSLGGMIAQQILTEKSVTENFNIKAVVTFGSPITVPFDRNGIKVVRFVDQNDIVPKMGENFSKTVKQNKELVAKLNDSERIFRKGAHKDGIETHALSYISDPIWSDLDFLGEKKTNVIELLTDITFYEAPTLE